ncbi:uncharacterized protein VP01_2137g4 [Puccinia sorghi]|uniref:Reverse transcriptase Ty1/copia-type domain-containing protein n=1 Tax=Puccinia sorghi TaxID=27349 RepID=A0A0L6V9Q2_9BASI|nr:uncharacterized protein VP01_2137g4 [Puccinia sorghi]
MAASEVPRKYREAMLSSNSSHDIQHFKTLISTKFRMEDLGKAQHISGIKLTRQGDGEILLNQETYTRSILETYGLQDSKTHSTPMKPNTRLINSSKTFLRMCKRNGISML